MSFSIDSIRADFPILQSKIQGKPLVYLDNAATTHKPKSVIQAITDYYSKVNANVHRASYQLARESTEAFENSRKIIQKFINAPLAEQIVWTQGTTQSINLVAFGWAKNYLKKGDKVLVSAMEHHANLLPWQQICRITGAKLEIIPLNEQQGLDQKAFNQLLDPRVRLVCFTHVSNVLGVINPIAAMIKAAKQVGAVVLVDGAQGVAHLNIDVQALGCDFYAFSSHKVYGPTGLGILYAKPERLEQMQPLQFGGEMVSSASYEHCELASIPFCFEAGTPNIAGAIGMAAGINYLSSLDQMALRAHEKTLYQTAEGSLKDIVGLKILAENQPYKTGAISLAIEACSAFDLCLALDRQGIAVRSGYHCAMPLLKKITNSPVLRLSFGLYNNLQEVQYAVQTLAQCLDFNCAISQNSIQEKINWSQWQSQGIEVIKKGLKGKGRHKILPALIQLGHNLPRLPNSYKIDENLVVGCESQIWLTHMFENGYYTFAMDSDARVVRGLLSVVLVAVNGKTSQVIKNFDFSEYLSELNLSVYLSESKKNGLISLIKQIKSLSDGH